MINNTLSLGILGILGIQGIQDGMAGMENAARKIARGGADGPQGTGNLAEPLIDMILYERSVEASAQVVKTADETLGTLLDIRA